jgi:hypothetical protein
MTRSALYSVVNLFAFQFGDGISSTSILACRGYTTSRRRNSSRVTPERRTSAVTMVHFTLSLPPHKGRPQAKLTVTLSVEQRHWNEDSNILHCGEQLLQYPLQLHQYQYQPHLSPKRSRRPSRDRGFAAHCETFSIAFVSFGMMIR